MANSWIKSYSYRGDRLIDLCPIVQWLATDARSDIQTINFPEEGE